MALSIIKNTITNNAVYRSLRAKYHWAKIHLMPESVYVKRRYKKLMGKPLNLKQPQTLNEKISWLKLNDRSELHTQCADKYAVREYVSGAVGEQYLIPLLYQTKDPESISPETIGYFPCVIKTNHDSGGVYIVEKPDAVNWEKLRIDLANRLKTNYYYSTKEWQYKNIEPRIIVEKFLGDSVNEIPMDYKLHVFNGRVNMIQVDMGRGSDRHYRNWYSPKWEREPYKWSSPKGEGKYTDPSDEDVDKPETLERMISLSEALAKPFDYVRVDWYDYKNELFFGEITFHHDGGNKPILPECWDLELGRKLELTGLK